MSRFACFSISPIELSHVGLAVATARAGGIGILDREFCRSDQWALARKNWESLLSLSESCPDAIGLRMRADQIAASKDLFESLGGRSLWLILSHWQPKTLAKLLKPLPKSATRQLLLEVMTVEQAQAAAQLSNVAVSGLIARGHEAGGWVGEDPAFLLTQKVVQQSSLPIYVQGGIGLHTAAACRAAGAAGVVLDDQLWLMPESPLPRAWQQSLTNLNGQEAILLGERLHCACRVLARPNFGAIAPLQVLADQIEVEEESPTTQAERWFQAAVPYMGWGDPQEFAWPMGQAVGLAQTFAQQYPTTGKLVQAILQSSAHHVAVAERLQPLQAGSPLAQAHKTTYPIVQGPMTRVSDTAAFANAVSQSGGLPMLALALMNGPQVRKLLQETQALVGDRSWGIGILGFVPQFLRDAQLEVVREIKPPFALIAGGRPDQAQRLEQEGIATYIHVPTANLLQLFLEQGARRFVFEGRECGGHVGPLSSFVLWEGMVQTLLSQVPLDAASDIHVLFAGGIHDGLSAAMISAIAAPLAERGMKVGVLMGTSYLFTEEAVNCGAILPEFQQVALQCDRTINLETGPGHASRCAVTPFAQEFYQTRRQMKRDRQSAEDIKNTLEELTLGRLRIATKGMTRNAEGQLVQIEPTQQQTDGMYMIGQVATLRSQTCTIAQLHQSISDGATQHLTRSAQALEPASETPAAPADVAIIGIATLLPGAHDPETFWQNILTKASAITEIPSDRWDWRLFYDPDRSARDKIYSKWGGFLEPIAFDPMQFGIPPKSLKAIEPMQLMALEAVRRALDDAGCAPGRFDQKNTCVILGAGGGTSDLGQQYSLRSNLPLVVDGIAPDSLDRLPEWTEESFAGTLLNVAAGRVANRFNLGGANYTVDAACASSLAAVSLAVKELESGRSNVAIAGGLDTVQNPMSYMCFSKTQALSPRGKPQPFDQAADGIVISEGICILVMKRLADAERDGDRIYAVIKAIEASSDGKALGMTAPRPAGQRLAVERAYAKAGFSPKTLGLYEAHGTGTAAGDRAELETLVTSLKAAESAPKSCAIGSVKSLIGHTKSTAGVAGLIKAALSLYHQVRPAHAGVTQPLAPLTQPDSPAFLLQEAQPWLGSQSPRRASVSAFGFGGTNFHTVLQEYPGNFPQVAPGGDRWVYELFLFRAATREALIQDLQRLSNELEAGAEPRLRDLAYSYALQAEQRWQQPVCLSLLASDLAHLQTSLIAALEHLQSATPKPLPPNLQLGLNASPNPGAIAFLFPGQGSQYPGMAREVALYFQEMRAALELADQRLQPWVSGLLSQLIYPPGAFSEQDDTQHKKQLQQPQVSQVAIGTVAMGFARVAERLGLQPAMAGGHSYGEYAALHYAGVLSAEAFLELSAERGRIVAGVCKSELGGMAAVQADPAQVQTYLKDSPDVVIANYNSPTQTVVSGDKKQIAALVKRLNGEGIQARALDVSGAFHSAFVAPAQAELANAIAQSPIHSPQLPIYSNTTAQPYAESPTAIQAQLSSHLVSPVHFIQQIEAMYAAGARVFVELGPKSVLTNLCRQILKGKDFTAVSLDGQGGGLQGLLGALGTLATVGVAFKPTALFSDRKVQALDLNRLSTTRKPPLAATTWLVNGGCAWPLNDEAKTTGKLPFLTQETVRSQPSQVSLSSVSPVVQQTQAIEVETQPVRSSTSADLIPITPVIISPVLSSDSRVVPTMSQTTSYPSNGNGHTTQASNYPPSYPSSYAPPQPMPMQPSAELLAFHAYQETMRQFLALQERVMCQFFGGGMPTMPTAPMPPAPMPVARMMPVPPPMPVMPPAPMPPQLYSAQPQIQPQMPPQSQPQAFVQPAPVAPQPPAPQPPAPIAPPEMTVVAPPAPVPAPIPTSQPTPNPQLPTSNLSAADLTQTLLQLVSDRTGYPPEMLGLDQDIEAELGIDSIKRVEVLGAIQKTLPAHLTEGMQSRMESLTRVKTLNALVSEILKLADSVQGDLSLGKSK